MSDWKLGLWRVTSVLLIIMGLGLMMTGVIMADNPGGLFTGGGGAWVLALIAEVVGLAAFVWGMYLHRRIKIRRYFS
ncbi:hypothetical protein Deba_2704 [Desulfarculus baarsii DSM 2075]|uniref:Uncharacterized protein n=1 Tax=Desulfarculus baarsii (strain ATCC 33931 / DSM 2075 / LMG 7858 / VKM B-1802 / 2st14) TaxID=644282 RepID=E1QKG5_DESB2|nr:hypothetical protein [Desulfarculus baarsii]ADK86058.1 hypothetical protein Deba_2704 [Desulfarculus baarsii DSM 2075]